MVAFPEGEDETHDGYFSSEEGEGQSHFQAEINDFLFIFIRSSLGFLDLPICGHLVNLGYLSVRTSFYFRLLLIFFPFFYCLVYEEDNEYENDDEEECCSEVEGIGEGDAEIDDC